MMKSGYNGGDLHIDHENGIITYEHQGVEILRITHLETPVPHNVKIDMVALAQLTSVVALVGSDPDTDVWQAIDGPETTADYDNWAQNEAAMDIELNGPVWVWSPPLRSTVTGHRISMAVGYKPVGTRGLNWRWWLAELPMRILARYMHTKTSVRDLQGEESK